MKCFYHNDADGKCAAYIIKCNYDISIEEYNGFGVEFIPMNHNGTKFPIETIGKNETIYIVDFSISPDDMRTLLKITNNVIWIDHHKTAIDMYTDFEYEIKGLRYDGIAGCMLTYCYLNHMTDRGTGEEKPFNTTMCNDAPMYIKLIADWDVWKFEYGDDTRLFNVAFNAYDFNPDSKLWWNKILGHYSDGEQGLIDEGKAMIKFRDNLAKDMCKTVGFECEFEGYKCYTLNTSCCNSEYFKSIDDGTYDILIPFSFNGTNWKYSLYSKTVDVSEIAKKYGGGGHKGASGFVSDKLLLSKNI